MDHFKEDELKSLPKDHKVQLMVSQPDDSEDEIDLGQLVRKVINGKRTILLFTLLAFLISSIGFFGYNLVLKEDKGTVSTVVAFDFDGIEEGLNPLGDTFNISEITSKKVLEDTISQLSLNNKGIDSEMLKRNMTIQGIVPEDIIQKIDIINRMAEKDVSQLENINELEYYPNQYKIDLNIVKGMNVDKVEAEQLLMVLVKNYEEYFMNKYNDREVLSSAINIVDLEKYDYSEYIMLINSQLGVAKEHLETMEEEAPEFRSKTTGVGFTDLLEEVDLVQNVDVNNVQAIINTFAVTKDKDKIFAIYQNKINSLEQDFEEHKQRAKSLREAAQSYKKDSMLILGSEGADNTIEITENSEEYDNFVLEAVEEEKTANLLKYDLDYYKELFQKLSITEKEDVTTDIGPYIETVENDIIDISEQVKSLVENINITVDEYYNVEAFKNSVNIAVPTTYSSNTLGVIKKGITIIAISSILGMMIGVFLALSKGLLTEEGMGSNNDK